MQKGTHSPDDDLLTVQEGQSVTCLSQVCKKPTLSPGDKYMQTGSEVICEICLNDLMQEVLRQFKQEFGELGLGGASY